LERIDTRLSQTVNGGSLQIFNAQAKGRFKVRTKAKVEIDRRTK
jgi:hypothetical protein